MKKLFSAFFVLLMLCGSAPILSGCGGGRASTDPADEMPADEDLTEDPIAEDNA